MNSPTDRALARYLKLSHAQIANARAGRTGLGPFPRLRILDTLDPCDLDVIEHLLRSSDALLNQIQAWRPPDGYASSNHRVAGDCERDWMPAARELDPA